MVTTLGITAASYDWLPPPAVLKVNTADLKVLKVLFHAQSSGVFPVCKVTGT